MVQMRNNTSGTVRSAVALNCGTWQGNCSAGLIHHQTQGFTRNQAFGYAFTTGMKPQTKRLWRPKEDST
jgi:hypothetical protein